MVTLDKTLNNSLFWNLKMRLLAWKKLNHKAEKFFWQFGNLISRTMSDTKIAIHQPNSYKSPRKTLTRVSFLTSCWPKPTTLLKNDLLRILQNFTEQKTYTAAMSQFFRNISRSNNFTSPFSSPSSDLLLLSLLSSLASLDE